MLIRFSDEFFQGMTDPIRRIETLKVLNAASRGLESGSNLYGITSSFLPRHIEELSQGLDRNTREARFMYFLASRYFMMGAVSESVSTRLLIQADTEATVASDSRDIVITTKDVVDGLRIDEPVILLGEFISDCYFYEKIYSAFFHNSTESFNMFEDNGGGQTTYQIFRYRILKQKRMVLAIVDSDCTSCSQPNYLGMTATKLVEVQTQLDCNEVCVSSVFVLPVAEKENLIEPNHYVSDLKSRELRVLSEIERRGAEGQDFLNRFDYKKGLKVSNISEAGRLILKSFPELQLKNQDCTFNLGRDIFKQVHISDEELASSDSYLFQIRRNLAQMIRSWGISQHELLSS